jgi:hypothetical protein
LKLSSGLGESICGWSDPSAKPNGVKGSKASDLTIVRVAVVAAVGGPSEGVEVEVELIVAYISGSIRVPKTRWEFVCCEVNRLYSAGSIDDPIGYVSGSESGGDGSESCGSAAVKRGPVNTPIFESMTSSLAPQGTLVL